MKYIEYIKFKKTTADEYVRAKIISEMRSGKFKQLRLSTDVGKIGCCVFDKEKFDKTLRKNVKKLYGMKLDLEVYWDRFFKYSSMYIQKDFLEQSYGYRFRRFGKYKDYGAVIFYGNRIKTNPRCAKELIEEWFYTFVYKSYIKALKRYLRFSFFSKKPFEFNVRWSLICDAVMYFDKSFSEEDVKKQIVMLSEKESLYIKHIDTCEIVFAERLMRLD